MNTVWTFDQQAACSQEPWQAQADGMRVFFCDGGGSIVLRGLRPRFDKRRRLPVLADGWFDELADLAWSGNERLWDYLAQAGHAMPPGRRDCEGSCLRIAGLIEGIAGPLRRAMAPFGPPVRPDALDPSLADMMEEAGALATGTVQVLDSARIPIVVTFEGSDAAQVVDLTVDLVEFPAAGVHADLTHFPAAQVAFLFFDDAWLSGFSHALREAAKLVAHSANVQGAELGRGLALRWSVSVAPLWRRLADAGCTMVQMSAQPLCGPSASAAFGLAATRLLARRFVRKPGQGNELRVLPVDRILVTAEVDAQGCLRPVGGTIAAAGKDAPKLAAIAEVIESRQLQAVAVAATDAPGRTEVGRLQLLRAATFKALAQKVCATLLPQRYGTPLPLPPRLELSDRPERPDATRVGAEVARLIRQGAGRIAVDVDGRYGEADLALAWRSHGLADSSAALPLSIDGWALGGRLHGGRWAQLRSLLLGLEASARLHLDLPCNPGWRSHDLPSRFDRLLADCSAHARKLERPVTLLLGGAGDADAPEGRSAGEALARWLPRVLPDGVHLVVLTAPGLLADTAWRRVRADPDPDAAPRLRLAQLPDDGWSLRPGVHHARLDPSGVDFATDRWTVVDWHPDWLRDEQLLSETLDDVPVGLPLVIARWPGNAGQRGARRLNAVLKHPRVRQMPLLVLHEAPVAVPRPLTARVREPDMPVDLGIVPGLDRGAWRLLAEAADADAVLCALRGAEAMLPAGQPRRWWLDVREAHAGQSALACASEDAWRLWLQRFPGAGEPGVFLREPEDPEAAAIWIGTHAAGLAVAVVSAFPARIDRMARALRSRGQQALRAEVSTFCGRPPVLGEPDEVLADFLAIVFSLSPSSLDRAAALQRWMREHPKGDPACSRFDGLDAAAAELAGSAPDAALELLQLVGVCAPSLMGALAEGARRANPVRDAYVRILAEVPTAFADDAASAAWQHSIAESPPPAGQAALVLALALVRDAAQRDVAFETLVARAPLAQRDALRAIGAQADPRKLQSLPHVLLAARAGLAGRRAVEAMLARRSRELPDPAHAPEPNDSLFWAALFTGGPSGMPLERVLRHPRLWNVLGLVTLAEGAAPADVALARLGLPLSPKPDRHS